jgi:DNA-directed RNA polymerase specialized sigma24 family protein
VEVFAPEDPLQGRPEAMPRHAFPPTRWSVILDAQDDDPAALATFCRSYWFPLYSNARRTGRSVADAEDLTQSFFERILSVDFLGQARRERGRLRGFLLRSFNNFAAEEWRKRGAQKRGGGQRELAFDALSAEERLALEPSDHVTPEVEYERAWARELLRQALAKVAADYEGAGNGGLFHAMRDQLTEGSSESSYRGLAESLGLSEASARFAAFKLRQRYRLAVHELVESTVASPEDVEKEMVHLRLLFRAQP